MNKSKILLSLMLGGVLIFSSVQASAFTTNKGTEIVTISELGEKDLTQYGFNNCGEGMCYRYDNNYKALIIIKQNYNDNATTLDSSAFENIKDINLIYIDGNIKFDDKFNNVVNNNKDMKVCIYHYEDTRDRFNEKYNVNSISFNYTPNEFYFINHNRFEDIVDYNGLLGNYKYTIDNIVGYKGCRINNRILIKTSSISETKATDTPSTSTPVIIKEIKEYEVIEEEPTFLNTGKSHIEIEENGVVTEVKASKEIPVLDESLKGVYYANDEKKGEDDKKNDVATETPKATKTPISTSTATTTTKDETQKPTGDSKNVLAVFGLGLVGLFSCNKLKKRM